SNSAVNTVSKPSTKRRASQNRGEAATPVEREGIDYVLYRGLVRKYTWYEGLGAPISKDVAHHLPVYYKLSMKNDNGHWLHVEAMHQDSLTDQHGQETYVLDKRNDKDESSKEWREKLNTVAQWLFIADLEGNEVMEERAYDKEGNLVYSFIPVRNADGRVIGSYNDAWGLPVDMRENKDNTYGSVVCITYDHCGRDSIIDFLDGEGLRKYNSNGVDQQRYQYDDKDRIVLVTSHNMVGDYAIDNWGNCGNRYYYDDDGNKYSVVRVDKYLAPMKMPSKRANGTRTFMRCDIRRDVWGRDVEAVMLDAEGNPDSTSTGIHKILYEYNDKGFLLSTTYLNINGEKLKEENVH
ncbi:MAG: hypothetical protein J5867_06945, partial [Prevotella sp.]|nr:hypothetical protein [Prevotella sp.]